MKRIHLYVEPEIHTRAKVVAARLGTDLSTMVRDVLANVVEQREAEVEARGTKQQK